MNENNSEKAKKLIRLMVEENLRGVPILVEGINDKKALKKLGVKGEIFIIQGTGRRLYTIAENVSNQSKRAIILTDPDHEGSRIAGQLADLLESEGVTPDLRFRKICSLMKVSQVAHLKADFE
jgi:5S rRNA maturation endonuclease (ribonuclease M5)